MKIAVLSGKGGAGKTLVAVNIASVIGNSIYVDCDVEEPNGHLFFKPENITKTDVNIMLPKHDQEKCIGCRKCVDFCKFNALAYVKNKVVIFDEVCHSCYGCIMVCPNKALHMEPKTIGEIHIGKHNNTIVKSGIINIGEASGVPIINQLLRDVEGENIVIDCPPGSACVVMESIKDADFCILVGEPTIFGVHNLNMVYELVKVFNKKCGVVLNKCIEGENLAEQYCNKNKIDILGKIPWDKELGKLSSEGKILVEEDYKYKDLFKGIINNIERILK